MNPPDEPLHEYFQRTRERDHAAAPAFAAMSATARREIASAERRSFSPWWLVPAAAAILLGVISFRPSSETDGAYSRRLAALTTEWETPSFSPTFAAAPLPTDSLPNAFTEN